VSDLSPAGRGDGGKLAVMQENDREPMDDVAHRPEDGDPRAAQAPATRLLANPRRVRRG